MTEVSKDGNTVTQRRKPFRVDVHYAITAWAKEPDDEHRLLAMIMMTLFRYQEFPEDVLPESLRDPLFPIGIRAAQYDTLEKPSDLWNVLDNQQRPMINCVVTMELNPFRPITTPAIRTRETTVGQAYDGDRVDPSSSSQTWSIGGRVQSKNGPLKNVRLTLVERGQEVAVQSAGEFAVSNLQAGKYTLEVSAEDRKPQRQTITVPGPDYVIEI